MASAVVTNRQEPPSKNKNTEPNSIQSLPKDLVVTCLARVSRLHYPTLSLVSKSFGSLLASPELHKTRLLLNRTESCLYVCLKLPRDRKPRWFTLKLNKTLTSKESSCHLLVPIPKVNSPKMDQFSLVGVGHNLYAICEPRKNDLCPKVSFLDCITNTWLKVPTLRLAHTGTHYDGYIYLAGSCENPESLNCVEVYNTKTQTWKLPLPPEKWMFNLRNMEGKIYDSKSFFAFSPKESKWERLGLRRDLDLLSACVIDNIIIIYLPSGKFSYGWFDNKVGGRVWRNLEGLEGLPKLRDDNTVKLADYGGKLVVLWDTFVPESECEEKTIWCAEISLEKRSSEDIWGKVEWFGAVLTVPKSYKYVCAVSSTLL